MEKKYNTINEEINRMKSLFGESRLYGNLVEQEVVNDDTCEWFKPKQKRSIEILDKLIKIADAGKLVTFNKEKREKIQELLLVLKESKKEIEGMDCEKGIEVICNPENRKKIDEGIEVIDEEKDGDDAKKFGVKDDLEELLSLLNEIKGKCDDFVNSEEETDNTEVVDNSEEETKVIEGCPPVDYDGCMVVTKETLEESMVDGVLDIYKLFGFISEFEQKCGTPKIKIPEELLSSITEIKKLEYPSMFKSDNGDIEFCNENFPNVTTIKQLVFDSVPFNIGKNLPNLKNVDDLFIDDFEVYYDFEDYSKVFSNLSVTNIFAVTEGTSHITFNGFKDKTLVSKNVENIDVNLVKGFDDDDYFNYLIDFGWIEKEGEDGVTFLTNPKNKVQDLDQVDVIGGKEGAEEEDDSDTDEEEVQSVGKPKMMVDDEEKDIIYTQPKLNKDFNIGKFVYDKSKDEFKIKSKYPFLLTRTNNLVERMEQSFWKTLSKWYDKTLNSDNTTLDIISDKKFKVKIK